jgi:hypothetical protein
MPSASLIAGIFRPLGQSAHHEAYFEGTTPLPGQKITSGTTFEPSGYPHENFGSKMVI